MSIAELYSGTEDVVTTEWSCTTDTSGPDADTTDGQFQTFLDVSDMVAGDELQIRVYEKTRSADTQRVVYQANLVGVQSQPIFVTPMLILLHGWDFTLKAVSGTITVLWSIRQLDHASAPTAAAIRTEIDSNSTQLTAISAKLPALVGGRVDASVGAMAANVMTAAAAAADLATELQNGLATASALTTVAGYIDTEVAAILAAVDTEVGAIKTKTDQLTFTHAGKVDSTTQGVHETASLQGSGTEADPWGPA